MRAGQAVVEARKEGEMVIVVSMAAIVSLMCYSRADYEIVLHRRKEEARPRRGKGVRQQLFRQGKKGF